MVIPAHPLAVDAERNVDERRQRGLTRYYLAAGVGGIAAGVHTTGFLIHDAEVGLYERALSLVSEEVDHFDSVHGTSTMKVAGIVGRTEQAVREARLASEMGYHAGLLSLSAMRGASTDELIEHSRRVAELIPVFGFYLQPDVGGMELPFEFWQRFAEIENVVAIKIAAFDRYRTIDVLRAVAESGRQDIALYTGNDDNIVVDLLTPFRFEVAGRPVELRVVGGLLGHWAFWTRSAVELLARCHELVRSGSEIPSHWLTLAAEVTDCNAAVFDPSHTFRGCLGGIHEVLRLEGLLEHGLCLDPKEEMSPGQAEEIVRVRNAYPHLRDTQFVRSHREEWLS